MPMLQKIESDKHAAVGLHILSREMLAAVGVVPDANVTSMCQTNDLSRQQIYEEKNRIKLALSEATSLGRGRPVRQGATAIDQNGFTRQIKSPSAYELEIATLDFRLLNPGSTVTNASGRVTYSDGFKRFILNAADKFAESDEVFCQATRLPLSTLNTWRDLDAKEPILPKIQAERHASWPEGVQPNELARTVTGAYELWSGSLAGFLSEASKRFALAPTAIRSVLRIAGMIQPSSREEYRYRNSTLSTTPGSIAVTDGKTIEVQLTNTQETLSFNWQGIVDQETACHLSVVVTETESAEAVIKAFDGAVDFLGKPPMALLHDQKPIHDDKKLREHIESRSKMIPATLGRGQNKAVIEGQFGLFEQHVGLIKLDSSSPEAFALSSAHEIIRAYTAGLNHAARFEYDGKSRFEIVRTACPSNDNDKKIVEGLKSSHRRGRHPASALPTADTARPILDKIFEDNDLLKNDPKGH